MKNPFFNIHSMANVKYGLAEVTDAVLAEINGLKVNGPLVPLKKEDVRVRAMYCIGESPTSKMSIHPNGEVNGKEVKLLDKLCELMPGVPMMEGHRTDKIPWARVFKAQVEDVDNEATIKSWYYFLAGDAKHDTICREIDAGIRSEGSISYFFKEACCSICHTPMEGFLFMRIPQCQHKIGKDYEVDGKQIKCYWYPNPESMQMVSEISHVFRGAYPKTKGALHDAGYVQNDRQADGLLELSSLIDNRQRAWFVCPCGEGAIDYSAEGDEHKCPACGKLFDADRKEIVPEPPAYKYHVCECGFAVDRVAPATLSPDIKCPSCEGALSGTNERPENLTKGKAQVGSWKYCVCPKCNHVEDHKAGNPCKDCPKCGTKMEGRNEKPAKKVKCAACSKEFDPSKVNLVDGRWICECGAALDFDGNIVGIDTKLKVGKPVGPVKPAKSGAVNNEFFDIEGFKDLEGEFFVEPKYDGVWMELHRSGETVHLFSDEGNDHAEKFAGIVADARAERGDNFIVAGEMIKMRGRQRLSHEDVSAFIHSNGPWDDKPFRFKAFDIMLARGDDVRKKTLADRRKDLDSVLSVTDQIHKTKFERVEGGDKLVKKIEELSSREGSMVKDVDGEYSKDGEKTVYKWKRQFEVDCLVAERKEKEGGGYVYTCTVGKGDKAQAIGKTFATSIKANKGQIIRVSVDKVTEDDGKYTWFAPKVVGIRLDKTEPDPISTLKKIAVEKGAGEPDSGSGNVISLSDIVPALLSKERHFSIFLVGGIVEKGYTANDVDIVFTRDGMTEEDRNTILESVSEDLRDRLHLIFDPNGPAGPYIELTPDAVERYVKGWKFANKFVIQKHWWGKKTHWDVRFGAPKTPRMWGWTCFSEPSKTAGGSKSRCQEKTYHDPKWMSVDGAIEPGKPGNPTKNLTAHMKIVDEGKYDFISRKPGFLEVVLHGDKFDGRYIWREITVKGSKNALAAGRVEGDETGTKSEKIWIMWKPENQTTTKDGGKVNKIAFRWANGTLVYWETGEEDTQLAQAGLES